MMNMLSKHIIKHSTPIKDALQMLNNVPETLTLFVTDDTDKLVGTLTDGDIRRGLIAGKTMGDPVGNFMFGNFRFLRKGKFTFTEVQAIKDKHIKLVPLIDDQDHILKLIDFNKVSTILPFEVVIMAGGRGERLKPLTDHTPKSLLHVGDKPILEINIDRLIRVGIDNFFITVKYRKEQIMNYFGNGNDKGIQIKYVEEKLPLGTIGSVGMINELEHENILVMNSDLLTNIDFEDFYKKYIEEDADMAVASIPYHIDLPYAVLETMGGQIHSFKEKPTYTYYSNAGIYLIKRKLIDLIPIEQHFNATDFMQELLERKHKLIYYPILGYWLDIGRPEDFAKANEDINHIKF
jgi:dTDP-glucose pyrophosphorylase